MEWGYECHAPGGMQQAVGGAVSMQSEREREREGGGGRGEGRAAPWRSLPELRGGRELPANVRRCDAKAPPAPARARSPAARPPGPSAGFRFSSCRDSIDLFVSRLSSPIREHPLDLTCTTLPLAGISATKCDHEGRSPTKVDHDGGKKVVVPRRRRLRASPQGCRAF